MSCVLTTAQPGDRSEWLLLPQLGRAQEFVYRGTYDEKAAGADSEFERKYSVRAITFVLDSSPKGSDVAFLTVLRPSTARGRPDEAAPSSARLEVVRVDPQGHLSGDGLAAPFEGPPTTEVGALVEVPKHAVGTGKTWSVEEAGRPPRKWAVVGTGSVNGTSCVKLVGVQQSDDWDRPRADRIAWRREDTVWVAPRLGVAFKVERVIQRREPAHKQPFYKSVLSYELETRSEYPRQIYDDVRREVLQTREFVEAAAPLLAAPGRNTERIDVLLGRIKYHTDHHAVAMSIYREPLRHLQHRLEAAKRGEAAPAVGPLDRTGAAAVAALGKAAPEFLTTDYTSEDSGRLRRFRGKPLLMIFYEPGSPLSENALRMGQEIVTHSKGSVAVVGLALSADRQAILRQRRDLKLTMPLFDGRGLRQSYSVKATPRLVVIDADGFLRGAWDGWGEEAREGVVAELRRWEKK